MSDFKDNPAQHRFELSEDGATTFANYRGDKSALAITHVETPEAARGKGTAARLMQAIVAHARADGIKLVARCPYAVAWFERHKQDADVLA
jgi:uncharacterized protein